MKPGTSQIGPSNSTPRAENTARSSSRSIKEREKEMIRTLTKQIEMHEAEEYLDHEDEMKYGFTYYLKSCLHLDRISKELRGKMLRI